MARSPLMVYRTAAPTERGAYADPFLMLHREMNRLFDDTFRGALDTSGQGPQAGPLSLVPHMDVIETETAVKIIAELPGVPRDAVDVTLNDDVLTIRGEKKSEARQIKENLHVSERAFGSFSRSIRLPFAVDAERIEADVEHGVLTVTLPKGKEPERVKRIQVGTGTTRGAAAGTGGGASGSSAGAAKPQASASSAD